jgi:integrase/recombinase XerC
MDRLDFEKKDYIRKFSDYIRSKNYSNKTLLSYLEDLYYLYIFSNKELIEIKEEDIREFITEMHKSKKSASTISRHISTYKTFYKYLYREEIINRKDYPLNKIAYPKKEKKLPRFLYYNDIIEIINESEKDKDGIRDRLIIEMLYATGVRVSELIEIKLSDIDFNNRKIRVLGKGNKERKR